MNNEQTDKRMKDLEAAVGKGKKELAENITRVLLTQTNPRDILNVLQNSMQAVGKLFQDQVLYLPELHLAGKAMQACSDIIRPELKKAKNRKNRGKVVLGTVEFDIHDIGKNLVKTILDSEGFEVIDVGVNCPAHKFIKAAKDERADIIAMSSLLTITMPEIKKVIELLKASGLDGKIKTMIGGAPISASFADEVGADGYAPDAFEAVKIAIKIMDKKTINS